MTTQCQGCSVTFEASSRQRRLCEPCRMQRLRSRWKAKESRARSAASECGQFERCAVMTTEQVGRRLRMSSKTVLRVERMAIAKLLANVRRGSLGDYVRARAASTAAWLRDSGDQWNDASLKELADELDSLIRDMDRQVYALLR